MKFYSKSKGALLDVEGANIVHLKNLKAKIERGEYRDENGDPLSADEETKLVSAIDAEVERQVEIAGQNEGFA